MKYSYVIPTHKRRYNGESPNIFLPDLLEEFGVSSVLGHISNSQHNAINVQNKEHSYKIQAIMPGVTKEDINIEIKDETLFITAKNTEEHEESEKEKSPEKSPDEYMFDYNFRIPLPVEADLDTEVEAILTRGILSLSIPKKTQTIPKKIEVQEIAA